MNISTPLLILKRRVASGQTSASDPASAEALGEALLGQAETLRSVADSLEAAASDRGLSTYEWAMGGFVSAALALRTIGNLEMEEAIDLFVLALQSQKEEENA